MRIYVSLLFLLLPNILFTEHPIHVTISNIDFNEKNKTYTVSIKIFKDDFEKVINTKENVFLNLGTEKELKNCDQYINRYIINHFKINTNGSMSNNKLQLQKKEIREDNAVWLFYDFKIKKTPQKIKIFNTLLADLYPDQKNLLIFTQKNTQQAITFDHSITEKEFEIE